jgi:hypothetical protein
MFSDGEALRRRDIFVVEHFEKTLHRLACGRRLFGLCVGKQGFAAFDVLWRHRRHRAQQCFEPRIDSWIVGDPVSSWHGLRRERRSLTSNIRSV